MKDIINYIERHRLDIGITKAEMARRIGANSNQQYNNWVYRESLPPEYKAAAQAILESGEGRTCKEWDLLNKVGCLSEKDSSVILTLVDNFLESD